MAVLKYYDGDSWEPVVSALQGPTGPVGPTGTLFQPNEPSNTGVLWVDTDDDGFLVVPNGGATGAVLTKASGNDYDTTWSTQATSYRNLIINGAMQVAQRNTSVASITTGGYYTADRFTVVIATQGTWTQSVENDAPTGSGFRKSLKMLCTTADSSPAAGDYVLVRTILEGQNLQAIKKGTANAEQLTLSFWVKSNVTGNYVASLYDADNTRLTGKVYTISSSATWEKKTITFSADTTGAFDNDNAASLYIDFGLGAGSDRTSGTLNDTWAAYSNANYLAGQTNLASATNNYWQITGVQLEVGAVATPFEFKPYAQDLLECQRYYYLVAKGSGLSLAAGGMWSATQLSCPFTFQTEMRTAPTLDHTTGTDYYIMWRNSGSDTFNSFNFTLGATPRTVTLDSTDGVSGTAGHAGRIATNNASASLAFSAEL